MIRYIERTGTLHATDLGRTASHFYIKYASIEVSGEGRGGEGREGEREGREEGREEGVCRE